MNCNSSKKFYCIEYEICEKKLEVVGGTVTLFITYSILQLGASLLLSYVPLDISLKLCTKGKYFLHSTHSPGLTENFKEKKYSFLIQVYNMS